MAVERFSLVWGAIPKSLVSLVLGILAVLIGLLALSSLLIDPIDAEGGIAMGDLGRISTVIIGMVAGFGFGMASWVAGFDVFPIAKSQPHWKMCRVCASSGIIFGVLGMLIYLVFITLLPSLLPVINNF